MNSYLIFVYSHIHLCGSLKNSDPKFESNTCISWDLCKIKMFRKKFQQELRIEFNNLYKFLVSKVKIAESHSDINLGRFTKAVFYCLSINRWIGTKKLCNHMTVFIMNWRKFNAVAKENIFIDLNCGSSVILQKPNITFSPHLYCYSFQIYNEYLCLIFPVLVEKCIQGNPYPMK